MADTISWWQGALVRGMDSRRLIFDHKEQIAARAQACPRADGVDPGARAYYRNSLTSSPKSAT